MQANSSAWPTDGGHSTQSDNVYSRVSVAQTDKRTLKITNPHSNKHSYDAPSPRTLIVQNPQDEGTSKQSCASCPAASGVTQEAQGRRWPRPLIPRRDVIIPTMLRRPIVASERDFRSAGRQSGRAWPGAQPSFNLAPYPASTIWLLIRAGHIAQLLEVFLGFERGWMEV